uniref:CID domain-containing protein n=1 Tax=Bursaphelenchus xylophilus TaxID=6326 RepID=A0A1I7RL86_BURXY
MVLDEAAVCDRFQKVNSSTDCVQTTSSWILSHKDEIDVITRSWMKVYQGGSESVRVALVYIVSDVVHNAKRERDKTISVAFHPHFVNAIVLASDTVKRPIKRCLEVFRERHIYPKHIIDEMQSALDGTADVRAHEDDDGDFEVEPFLKTLQNYVESSNAIDKAKVILNNIDFELDENTVDMSDSDALSQMELEVDLMIQKLQTFLQRIEGISMKSAKVSHTIIKSKAFFHTQLKDVAMVHDAYDRYAKGISERIDQLEPIIRSGVLPGQTPPRDAPSPIPGEDPFNENGSDDMEMDEEDMPGRSSLNPLIPPQNYVPEINPTDGRIKLTTPVPGKTADPRQSRFQPPPIPPYPPGFSDLMPKFTPNIPPPMISPMSFPPPHFDSQIPPPPGVVDIPPSTSIGPPGEDLDLRKEGNGYSNGNQSFTSFPPPSGSFVPAPEPNNRFNNNYSNYENKRRNGNYYDRNDFGGPRRKNFRRGSYHNGH